MSDDNLNDKINELRDIIGPVNFYKKNIGDNLDILYNKVSELEGIVLEERQRDATRQEVLQAFLTRASKNYAFSEDSQGYFKDLLVELDGDPRLALRPTPLTKEKDGEKVERESKEGVQPNVSMQIEGSLPKSGDDSKPSLRATYACLDCKLKQSWISYQPEEELRKFYINFNCPECDSTNVAFTVVEEPQREVASSAQQTEKGILPEDQEEAKPHIYTIKGTAQREVASSASNADLIGEFLEDLKKTTIWQEIRFNGRCSSLEDVIKVLIKKWEERNK